MKHTGKIEIIATALEPIVHGAGNAGNTQLLRRRPWWYVDDRGVATEAHLPFVSGNSVKHRIRDGAVRYALDAMGVEDGSRTKAEIDLLFSGGHLNKSGAAVDLSQARKLAELFPALSLCGYSAGNAMEESKISVDPLNLVCRENRDRMPAELREHPMAAVYSDALCSEEFGTRHDKATSAIGRRWLTAGASADVAERKTKLLGAAKKKGKPAEDAPANAEEARGDSAQMIYETQVISAGAVLWGAVRMADLTDNERAALASAFHYASTGRIDKDIVMGIGAKNSVGYGAIKVELRTSLRVAPVEFATTTAIAVPDDWRGYAAHLRERRDEILAAIHEAVA